MTYIKCLEGDKQGKHGEEKLYGKKKKKRERGVVQEAFYKTKLMLGPEREEIILAT